jgi:8-oxo-dGTP pyrophosphatase MutT (NUDIX family)
LPLRRAVRALVLDPDDRALLVRFAFGAWAPPGGGVDPGESDEDAIRRELREESGLRDAEVGPCVWTREHWFPQMEGFGGQTERIYLVRTSAFEPAPEWTAQHLAAEGVVDQRWWTPEELAATRARFAPRRLPELVRELLRRGPPEGPVDVGV